MKKQAKRPSRAKPATNVKVIDLPQLIAGEPLRSFDPLEFLDTSTRARLRKFAEAHHGADTRVIVNKAVEDFITADLGRNQGVSDEM